MLETEAYDLILDKSGNVVLLLRKIKIFRFKVI